MCRILSSDDVDGRLRKTFPLLPVMPLNGYNDSVQLTLAEARECEILLLAELSSCRLGQSGRRSHFPYTPAG